VVQLIHLFFSKAFTVMKMKLYFFALMTLLSLMGRTQAGELDLAFGINGYQRMNFTRWADVPKAMTINSDQNLLITGYSQSLGGEDFYTVSLNPDGQLNNSFAGDGSVVTNTTGQEYAYDIPRDIATRPTGETVVAVLGSANYIDLAIFQFDSFGSPDPNFGSNGIAHILGLDLGSSMVDIAVLADGKLLLSIASLLNGETKLIMIKLLTTGELDSSFGVNGILESAPVPITLNLEFFHVENFGDKVVIGGSVNVATEDLCLIEFNLDGTLENSFGANGIKVIQLAGEQHLKDLEIQSDGKILGCGNDFDLETESSDSNAILFRLLNNGQLDTDFGGTGIIIPQINTQFVFADNIKALSSGGILMAGTVGVGFNTNFLAMRFNTLGEMDMTFSGDGMNQFFMGETFGETVDMVIQSDGKAVLTAYALTATSIETVVIRILSDTPASIDNITRSNLGTKVFPNPLSGNIIQISFENVDARYTDIQIFNITGDLIYSKIKLGVQSENVVKIELPEGVPNGMYFISLLVNGVVFRDKFCKI
jgi:uncharacterized delta-60 repeat protein